MEALARAEAHQRVPLMDLTREFRAHRHEILAACERVLARMHLLGGEEVRAFEAEAAAYLGVRHVRGVASGTDALRLAVRAAGLCPGDEVLIQANAFVAAVEALYEAGARPRARAASWSFTSTASPSICSRSSPSPGPAASSSSRTVRTPTGRGSTDDASAPSASPAPSAWAW